LGSKQFKPGHALFMGLRREKREYKVLIFGRCRISMDKLKGIFLRKDIITFHKQERKIG